MDNALYCYKKGAIKNGLRNPELHSFFLIRSGQRQSSTLIISIVMSVKSVYNAYRFDFLHTEDLWITHFIMRPLWAG